MNSGSRPYTKIYSERVLDTVDLSKKTSSTSLTGAETSERMFTLLRDVLEETLERSDHELEELAFMNLKIAEVITKSDLLARLHTTNELKAVLFQLIILVKEQCVGGDRADSLEMMELKLKYNTLRASYSELKNAVSQARMLVGESGLLLSQLAYESGSGEQSSSKSRRVESLQKQFETIKKKLVVFENGGASPSTGRRGSEDDSRNALVERLQDSLQARRLQLDTVKNELAIQKKKQERVVEQLQQERESLNHEVQMLRARITQLREHVNVPAPPTANDRQMLEFLLMQSRSLEVLIQHQKS